MPGYIHTCENCSAHMQVHERYLGRTLRCTSCRTEFLAMLPEDVEVDEAPPVEIEAPVPRASRKRYLWWLLLLIPAVALVWWLGQDQSSGFGARLLKANRSTGELSVLERPAEGPVVVALDADSAAVLAKAVDAGDDAAMRALIRTARGYEMAQGTKVRILGSANRNRYYRVRIISGPWESRTVWVPVAWVR